MAISGPSTSLHKAGQVVGKQLEQDLGVPIELVSEGTSSKFNFELLNKGEVDFAIGSNVLYHKSQPAAGYSKIRTIIPLYEMYFLILHREEEKVSSLGDLIRGKKVGIGPRGSNTSKICKDIFNELGLDTTQYDPVYVGFDENSFDNPEIEICCFFTGLFNPRIKNMIEQPGVKIFDFEPIDPINQDSWRTTGICQKLWTYYPSIIPVKFFGDKPLRPVHTLSLQACLYGTEDTPSHEIQTLIEQIVIHKPSFMTSLSSLQGIDDSYSKNYFYPIHQGAYDYLHKNEPSFWERNVELIGLGLSILLFPLGILMPIYVQQRASRRKTRIRRYDRIIKELIEISMAPSSASLNRLKSMKRLTVTQLDKGTVHFDSEMQNLLLFFNQVETHVIRALENEVENT